MTLRTVQGGYPTQAGGVNHGRRAYSTEAAGRVETIATIASDANQGSSEEILMSS
jgi:hypothetical protein